MTLRRAPTPVDDRGNGNGNGMDPTCRLKSGIARPRAADAVADTGRRTWLRMCLLFWACGAWGSAEFPEQEQISSLLSQGEPAGVLFLIMEEDDEALEWVLPRLLHYSGQLRRQWPNLPLAVLSHGEEMHGLLKKYEPLHPELHEQLKRLIEEYGVNFHVCGTYAAMADVAESEFPSYVDVVPFGPAEIENYRNLEFQVVSVERTW